MHTVSRWLVRLLPVAAGSVLLALPSTAAPQAVRAGNVQARGGAQETFPPPPSTPVLDPFPDPTTAATVQLGGTVERADTVEIHGPLGTRTFPVVGNGFTATIPLVPDTINDLFVTGIRDGTVRGAPALVRATRDLSPPELFVDSPLDGATTTEATVDVAGRVGDLLSGFQGLRVFVNGVQAEVDMGLGTNGTYFAAGVPVAAGATTELLVTATDLLGNTAMESVEVMHVTPPAGSATIERVSGDGQSAQGSTELPAPIVVRVLRGDGAPFSGKLVTFAVTRSDGALSATSGGATERTLQVFTDAQGEARAWWRLGTSAGCGNNRVVASAVDVFGSVEFDASAAAMPPARVLVGTGNNQVTEVGTEPLLPLEAWVTDGCNGIAGVPVTFTAVEGGGSFGGMTSTVAVTDATGLVRVPFRLGLLPGSNLVEATFPGNVEPPAVFAATGVVRDPQQPTVFGGLVLDDAGRPLGGAEVLLDVNGAALPAVSTTDAGTFEIPVPGPGGPAHLHVDGGTVTTRDGLPVARGTYPHLAYRLVVVENVDNRLPEPIRLPELKAENHVPFTNEQDVELTMDGIPGVVLRVKAGSMTRPDGTVPSAADPALLSVNQVQFEDIPMPLPNGAAFPIAWTLQPSNATFDPPIQVELPNAAGLPAGAAAYLFSFDHDIEQFSIVATASVTDDGTRIVTDPGAGIAKAGWAGVCPPYPPRTRVSAVLFPGWQSATSWFGVVVGLLDVLENPCNRFQDGTAEGELLRRACAQNGLLCLEQALGLGQNEPGTMNLGMPPTELQILAEDALTQFLVYRASLNGTTVPTVAASLVFGDEYRVVKGVPGRVAEATYDVTFSSPPDLVAGDALDQVGLFPYSDGPGVIGIDVLTFFDPLLGRIRVRVFAPDFLPRGTVFAGGQSISIRAPGAFLLTNVPAMEEIPLRPIVVFEGVDEQYVIGPDAFQLPTIGGVTDFGMIDVGQQAQRRTDITVDPPVTAFSSLGATSPLDVDVTLRDGTVMTAESNADGSGYIVSNPGVVSVDGFGQLTAENAGTAFVTVVHEGLTETVSVLVSPGDPLTTVAGVVTLADGLTPVAGADVRVFPGDLSAVSAADGSFAISGVPTQLGPLTLRVRADVAPRPGPGTTPAVASLAGVTPVPDAFTDVGVVVLETPVFWAVDANGAWEDGANWSTGNPPAPGDAVLIDRPAGTFTVTVNSAVNPAALFCEENLNVAGVLEVDDPFPFPGAMNLQSGTLRDVVILPAVGGAMTSQSGGNALDGVTLGIDLTVNNLTDVTVTNGLTLDGATVSLQAASGGVNPRADLIFSGPQTLDGVGEIELTSGGTFNRVLVSGGPLTIEAGVPIRGLAGRIGTTGETIVLRSSITAETGQAILVPGDLLVEDATVQATSTGRVDLQGSVDLAGSVLSIDGEVRFLGTIAGGSVTGPSTGFLRAASDPTLDAVDLGVRLVVPANELVTVRNGLTLSSVDVEVSGPPAGAAFTGLLFDGAQVLAGTGEVVFNGSALNRFQLQDGPLVVESGVPIRGLNARFDSDGETIVLRSSITVAGTGPMAVLNDLVTEGATLASTSTGRIQLEGDVDNTGDVLTIQGEVRFLGEILGGTVQGDASSLLRTAGGSAVLDGVDLGVELRLPDNGLVTVRNGMNLSNATVSLSNDNAGPPTRFEFEGSQSLTGTGEIRFVEFLSSNRVTATAGSSVVLGPGIDVRGGGGLLGSPGATLTLQGSVDTDPGTRVSFDGDFINDGTIVVGGDAGTIATTAGGSYTQTSAGRLELDLAGTTAGTGYDQLDIAGAASLAGHLQVTVVPPYVPTIGDSFNALFYGSATGAFDSATAVGMPSGTALLLTPLATRIQLDVVSK